MNKYIVKSICHICGNKTNGKIGIWCPPKEHWYSRKEEYDVPLCNKCYWRIYLKYRDRDIIGVKI